MNSNVRLDNTVLQESEQEQIVLLELIEIQLELQLLLIVLIDLPDFIVLKVVKILLYVLEVLTDQLIQPIQQHVPLENTVLLKLQRLYHVLKLITVQKE